MYGMDHECLDFKSPDIFMAAVKGKKPFDYIYLCAHANMRGFGEKDGTNLTDWCDFARVLCDSNTLDQGAVLLLACCRGGLKGVAVGLFECCPKIDYVCGPRWLATGPDLTAGLHVFIYNREIRREQPSVAVKRSSDATGYDFFCYDRIELENDFMVQRFR
jgi:hypothetical protein